MRISLGSDAHAARQLEFLDFSIAAALRAGIANDRIINRLERVYSLYGKGGDVDSVISVGGHAYRQDIRQAAYRFINTHLKGDPRPVTDSMWMH